MHDESAMRSLPNCGAREESATQAANGRMGRQNRAAMAKAERGRPYKGENHDDK